MTLPTVSFHDALVDPALLGSWLAPDGDFASWRSWLAVAKAMDGLPLDRRQRRAFAKLAGKRKAPTKRPGQVVIIASRRCGKSTIAAARAVHAAVLTDWRPYVRSGERPTILVVSPTRAQSQIILGMVKAILARPIFERLVTGERADAIELGNIVIEIGVASHRHLRGKAICLAILDECSFITSETSANGDEELIRGVLPGQAQFGDMSQLICITSPYRRSGFVHTAHKASFGRDDPTCLVLQGGSRDFNPLLDKKMIAAAVRADPQGGRAEWLGQWRDDLAQYVDADVVEACVVHRRTMLPPGGPDLGYRAFADPAGGSGKDSFTMAIAHREGETVVIDCAREAKPRFSPEQVVEEFASVLHGYGLTDITGDRFGGLWPREAFDRHGIGYVVADRTRSEIYLAFLPLLNSRRVELLDDERTVGQITSLERRTTRTGRDIVDHPPGMNDDLANVIGGVSELLARRGSGFADFGAEAFMSSPPLLATAAMHSGIPLEQMDDAVASAPTAFDEWARRVDARDNFYADYPMGGD